MAKNISTLNKVSMSMSMSMSNIPGPQIYFLEGYYKASFKYFILVTPSCGFKTEIRLRVLPVLLMSR